MKGNQEILQEPAIPAHDPVRIQVLCMADMGGRTERLAFSRTIDADAASTAYGRDGGLNVTVNVLNVTPRRERPAVTSRSNDRRASTRYWMDSLPCLSNRLASR